VIGAASLRAFLAWFFFAASETGADAAAKAAADAGVIIIAVGIGSPEGDIIPQYSATGSTDYVKDRSGKTVVSRLGEKTLLELAAATGGTYIRYSNPEAAASEISSQLKKIERSRWQSKGGARYKNRSQWPLILAFFLLLARTKI